MHKGYFAAVEKIANSFVLPTTASQKGHATLQFAVLYGHSYIFCT